MRCRNPLTTPIYVRLGYVDYRIRPLTGWRLSQWLQTVRSYAQDILDNTALWFQIPEMQANLLLAYAGLPKRILDEATPEQIEIAVATLSKNAFSMTRYNN